MKGIRIILESRYAQVPNEVEVIYVEDDATDQEIREEVEATVLNMVEYMYEEIEKEDM